MNQETLCRRDTIERLLLSIIRDDKLHGGLLSTETMRCADIVRTELNIDIPRELAG